MKAKALLFTHRLVSDFDTLLSVATRNSYVRIQSSEVDCRLRGEGEGEVARGGRLIVVCNTKALHAFIHGYCVLSM